MTKKQMTERPVRVRLGEYPSLSRPFPRTGWDWVTRIKLPHANSGIRVPPLTLALTLALLAFTLLFSVALVRTPDPVAAQEPDQVIWEAQLTVGQPEVGRSTRTGWDRSAKYPGDNLTQKYIDVDGYQFNIVRIYAISHPSNPGTPTSFLFVIEDDTYAQVSKILGATLRVGDREFALARAGAETRVGSTRVFWWDPGNPRWSEGDEVNLQLTVPAETCLEFTDPTPVSQVKLDMGYGWKPRFGVLEGWHTVSGPVNGERYAPVNGDSWADSHRLQSGSASFTYAGRTYELRSVVNNGYNPRMWVEFSSEEPFPDEFAEDSPWSSRMKCPTAVGAPRPNGSGT